MGLWQQQHQCRPIIIKPRLPVITFDSLTFNLNKSLENTTFNCLYSIYLSTSFYQTIHNTFPSSNLEHMLLCLPTPFGPSPPSREKQTSTLSRLTYRGGATFKLSCTSQLTEVYYARIIYCTCFVFSVQSIKFGIYRAFIVSNKQQCVKCRQLQVHHYLNVFLNLSYLLTTILLSNRIWLN